MILALVLGLLAGPVAAQAKDLPPEARVSPTEISEKGLQLATLSEFKEYAEREFLVTKLRENGTSFSRPPYELLLSRASSVAKQ